MPNLRMSCLPGLALLVAGASTVAAQDVPSPYRFVEWGQEGDVFAGVFNADPGRFGFGPGDGRLYGLRYSLELSGPLALEAVGTYVDATRDVVQPGLGEGTEVIGEAPADLFFVDVRLRMSLTGRRTWHRMTPYVFAGGGLGFGMSGITELDRELENTDRFEYGTEFEANLGAGIRFHLRDRWVVRADGTLMLYQIDVPEGYRDPERGFEAVPESEWTNNTALTLGFSYLF